VGTLVATASGGLLGLDDFTNALYTVSSGGAATAVNLNSAVKK